MPSTTDVVRVELAGSSFDALSAVHFLERFPPHFHDTFAIGVVEQGRTRISTLRGSWTATTGSILAFSPGETHAAMPISSAGYTYRMLYPSADMVRALGVELTHFSTPVIDDPALAAELIRAHDPLMEGAGSRRAEWRLVRALRALAGRHGRRAGAHDCTSTDERDVEFAQDYLAQRFAHVVPLPALADACNMSQFRLIRMFRRVLGVTPHAYLVQLRVNRAQAMLNLGARVSDVAYSCGFSDQSHFTRTFKRAVGVPPGQYVRSVHTA